MRNIGCQSGFTLIETIIVAMILGVLLAVAAPSFSSWIANAQIRTKSEAVMSGLYLARSEAIKRNAGVVFSLNANSSWTVGCAVPVGDEDEDGLHDCPSVIQQKAADEDGKTVAIAIAPGGATKVTYNGVGSIRANPDNTSAITTININSSTLPEGAAKPLRVLLSGGGVIKLCDPSVTTNGDPRKC